MRNFLWGTGPGGKVKSKASWKSVCLPKYEGGLGIKRISYFNKALITSHIWSIVTDRESLWVRWIHSYKLKGRNFWDVTPCGSMSWGWRKILLLRDTIRPHIWKKIGNGLSTSIHPPVLHHNIHDRAVWKDLDGVEQEFSVSEVWNAVRCKQDKVPWVWGQIKHMANMSAVVESWDSIAGWLISRSSSTQNSAESVIARLLVAAASYFLWLERNSRLFSNTKCSEAQVREKIVTTLRLKLLSLKFKATTSNRQLLKMWDIPMSNILHASD
uniref:uncharacterized protein LOC122585600 n=1 Tax=Erigeron canadensis TaxID=72917 RepID=UPI001CB9A605|nr:uncharacterized protein LOC122585600 [Erigeron canadensis]